ncbi:MAG: hypothetical protein M3Q44_07510 [bacterium]|nr:hypothetical protein [bacterium]
MKKLLVSYTTIAMLAVAVVSPMGAFAEVVGNIGNGVDSNSSATVNSNNSTTVSQSNAASVTNTISVKSNTGDNNASRNTGGEVGISTGNAGASVGISNMANSNSAKLDTCCTAGGDSSVLNQGNGDSSDNDATLNKKNSTALSQTNIADVANFVNVDSNTGNNKASRNTGSGNGSEVSIDTGRSIVSPILIKNAVNSNQAVLGSSVGAFGNGDLTIGNAGNGVESDNDATANLNNSTAVAQTNAASILNWVDVTSNTGDNDADRNTGGDVMIDTGDSAVAVVLDNKANSNAAWLDNCGCVGLDDLVVKNLGNGDSTDNDAKVNKNNSTAAYQANLSEVANFGYFDTNSGGNKANRNTGAVYGWSDPSVDTGVAYTEVGATTAVNNNVLNNGYVGMTPPPVSNGNLSNGGYWWNYGMMWNGNSSY